MSTQTETELEEPEIEAVLPLIYKKSEKPANIKEIKPIVKQDVQPIIQQSFLQFTKKKKNQQSSKKSSLLLNKTFNPSFTKKSFL